MKSLIEYVSEKLLINKDYVDLLNKNEIKEMGWKNVKIEDVDKQYVDININSTPSYKRFYNKDGSPTNWFAWWMLLCIYGPMTKKEMLRQCGLPEGSYSKTWADMSSENIVYYDAKRRVTCPRPMSKWTIWK